MLTSAPWSFFFRMKASSTSTRGAMKRSVGIAPGAKNMSSSSVPKSGSSIWLDCCIAREVRPILWPRTWRPSAIFMATQARATA
jgi:hypothetical protein